MFDTSGYTFLKARSLKIGDEVYVYGCGWAEIVGIRGLEPQHPDPFNLELRVKLPWSRPDPENPEAEVQPAVWRVYSGKTFTVRLPREEA